MPEGTQKTRKITLKRNIPMLIVGLLFFAFALWVMTYYRLFIAENNLIERRNMVLYLALMALPVVLTQVKFTVSERTNVLIRLLYVALGTFVSMVIFNSIAWGWPISNTALSVVINLTIAAGFYAAIWAFVWNIKVAAPVACMLLWGLAYVYYMVFAFRGTPVIPEDLLTIGTALNVAGEYKFFVRRTDMVCLCAAGAYSLLGWAIPSPKPRARWAKVTKPVYIALSVGWVVYLCTSTFLPQNGFYIPAWKDEYARVAGWQGALATFVTDVADTVGLVPEGYDEQAIEAVEETLDQYASVAAQDSGIRPNVIVVMNESFADYAEIWQLETNQDILPFWHSLSENATKGHLFVSVLGGRTCHTEHHFLTSTQYAPLQNTPLYSTVSENTPSLAWQLKSLGYKTVAIHPYEGANYERNIIYPKLGFDTFLTQDAFEGSEKYRNYYSDRACYQKIKELYENKEADEPLFVFTVTMQNHGGFNEESEPSIIELYNEDEETGVKEEYLNCLHESDAAFSELVAYFEKQQEPTIILMFGDHQIVMDFESPMRNDLLDVEEKLATYMTTYAIWANYPIQSEERSILSEHYLAPILLKAAGLPLTEYDAFLLDVAKQYPVVSPFGYADSQGRFTEYTLSTQTEPLLQQMDIMRYNRLYDSGARLKELAGGMPSE